MNVRSKLSILRAPLAALAVAASMFGVGASSAQAQYFNWDSALPPGQIERMIQASGYQLTGPVMRRGPVYLANVLGRRNDPERLVIDAQEGRLLQRFPGNLVQRREAYSEWPKRPSSGLIGWFGGGDNPPRPPADTYSYGEDAPIVTAPLVPPAPANPANKVARFENESSAPIITDPGAAQVPAPDKPKPKNQVKHRKPDTTPVASPTIAPKDAKTIATAPAAATPKDDKATSIAPQTPPAASSPTRPETASAPAPRVADKAAAPPIPTAAPAAPSAAPAAPSAAPAAPEHKSVNDVPVAPLE